jgi:hypothetical protein
MFTKNGEIKTFSKCLEYNHKNENVGVKDKLITYDCHNQSGNQKWTVENDHLVHGSGYCIELSEDNDLIMQTCDPDNIHQNWEWNKRK